MRLKCNPVCGAFAWAPASLGTPSMIATATYPGSMSDDFGSDATLSILLADTMRIDEEAMRVVGEIIIPDHAYRVDWSTHTGAQGVIAVACANGNIYIYSADKVLKSAPPKAPADGQHALLWTITEHAGKGAVRTCHFNAAQKNCIATGGDDGQWFVWSLPATPADKSAPQKVAVIPNAAHAAAIVDVRWHAKNSFILATASTDGVVKVWNLSTEKLASSLNVQRASQGAALTSIAWHPTAATLAVGLDDPHPAVQIWDLRKAIAPTMELSGHTRGVTALSWGAHDAETIASCDAAGHTLWWDVQTGEQRGELQAETSYMVDVQWSPATPGVLATSSFEPSLCVSTAQSAPSAASGGPEWMNRPCGASINIANVVASILPGTETTLVLTSLPPDPIPPALINESMIMTLNSLEPGSSELEQWLAIHGGKALAAVSASQENRQPMLRYLMESGESKSNNDDDDPFAELAEENAKPYEERVAECVVQGQLEQAVDLCVNEGRFADAFVLAMLRGVDLVNKVRDAYIEYTRKAHPERRHVLYASAIATGDYSALIHADVPWREALSAIVSFAGEEFADVCNAFGDVLKARSEMDGAYTCYLCSRNVNAVMELWHTQGRSRDEVINQAQLLERAAGRRCTHPFFTSCLREAGMILHHAGHLNEANRYLQQAAERDDPVAQQLADRMRFWVADTGVHRDAPFLVEAVSDVPSQKVQEWTMARQAAAAQAAQQQQQQQQHQYQQQQQYQQPHQYPSQQSPQQYPPQQQPPQQYPPQQQQQQHPPQQRYLQPGSAPASQPPPPAAGDASVQYRPSPMPSASQGMPPQPHRQQQQQQQYMPSHAPPPAASRPPLMPSASAYPSQPQGVMPPAPGFPAAPPAPATSAPPPPPPRPSSAASAGGSGLMSHLPTPAGPPQPRLMPHPVSAFSSMRAGSTPNSAAALPGGALPANYGRAGSQPYPSMGTTPAGGSLAGSMAGAAVQSMPPPQPPQQAQQPPPPPPAGPQQQASLATMNINEIAHPAAHQTIQRLQQILPQIADVRRRGAIEQAAVQLFYALRAQQLPEDLIQMMYQLVCNAGSPTVRTMWSQISTRHPQLSQQFANLRFL